MPAVYSGGGEGPLRTLPLKPRVRSGAERMRNETHTLAKKYAQANPDKTIGRRPKKGKPYLGRVELRGVDYKVRQQRRTKQ